jgi:hypothetical protein
MYVYVLPSAAPRHWCFVYLKVADVSVPDTSIVNVLCFCMQVSPPFRVLGIKSNRSTVVKALAEKLTLWIPGL